MYPQTMTPCIAWYCVTVAWDGVEVIAEAETGYTADPTLLPGTMFAPSVLCDRAKKRRSIHLHIPCTPPAHPLHIRETPIQSAVSVNFEN